MITTHAYDVLLDVRSAAEQGTAGYASRSTTGRPRRVRSTVSTRLGTGTSQETRRPSLPEESTTVLSPWGTSSARACGDSRPVTPGSGRVGNGWSGGRTDTR